MLPSGVKKDEANPSTWAALQLNLPQRPADADIEMSCARPFRSRLPHRCRGVTLIEAMLAAVILAGAVVAVSQAVLAGQMQSADAVHRRRATELATSLMEEILRLPYADPDGASTPGPEGGESGRGNFDNIDDYQGFSEAAGSLNDAESVAYDDAHQSFARSVVVSSSSMTIAGLGNAQPGVDITVTVTDGTGATWSLVQFVPEPAE